MNKKETKLLQDLKQFYLDEKYEIVDKMIEDIEAGNKRYTRDFENVFIIARDVYKECR